MDLTSVTEDGMILPSCPPPDEQTYCQIVPWDDPYPYYRCMLPKDDAEANIEEAFPLPEGDIAYINRTSDRSVHSAGFWVEICKL